jgi:hypothetical protein
MKPPAAKEAEDAPAPGSGGAADAALERASVELACFVEAVASRLLYEVRDPDATRCFSHRQQPAGERDGEGEGALAPVQDGVDRGLFYNSSRPRPVHTALDGGSALAVALGRRREALQDAPQERGGA